MTARWSSARSARQRRHLPDALAEAPAQHRFGAPARGHQQRASPCGIGLRRIAARAPAPGCGDRVAETRLPRSRCGYPLARAGAAIHLRRWYRSAWRWVTDRLRPARPGHRPAPALWAPAGTGRPRLVGTDRYRPGAPPHGSPRGLWSVAVSVDPSLWPPAPADRRRPVPTDAASGKAPAGGGELGFLSPWLRLWPTRLGPGGRPLLIWQERLAGAAGDGSVGEVGGEVREGEAGGVGGHRDQAGGGEAGAGVDLEDLARAVEVEDGVDSRDVAAT